MGTSKWGDPWDLEKFPTPPPLFPDEVPPAYACFEKEANNYNWMCYAEVQVC